MNDLEKKVKELEFQLKALRNFVYQHHHNIEIDVAPNDDEPYFQKHETSKPKVWVEHPDGMKEEPKEEG